MPKESNCSICSTFKGLSNNLSARFYLKEGMGEGGITALVVKVGNKTPSTLLSIAHMVSGLRERYLPISLAGFNESEVFTTDTHSEALWVEEGTCR